MKNIIFVLFCIVLFNCNKSEAVADESVSAMTVIEDENSAAPLDNKTDASVVLQDKAVEISEQDSTSKKGNIISKKIIKNGEMEIQVDEIKKAHQKINEIIKNNTAYIQTERFSNNDTAENLNLTIRVPHQNFDALINSFSDGVGSILSKNISSDDVTEEYTDVSIKLTNKKIYLEKYRDMLRSAKTTKDMLEIQENIRELEDEIDVSEGRLRYIDDRVDYSTLNLNLYKEKVRSSATSKIGFGSRFGDSVTEGWNSFVAFFLGLISLWPFLLLIPIIIVIWKKWRKNRRKI
ncbi:DUF4349 domain-containing protein [Chryseobacterium chendengshani]|uniref:DUF4349 domain-containing protein n=1 Tax=Chryseobacterium sp. LJ668 TaxID=2864040 RepID=UPI001C688EBC|nr:DUF4349 domain-containing protein [Chryseobacterium sp. LJ668]MBW8523018.1 DUF4349 domain-containing protein [Chryseobacterium sp. LJ668]QYK16547.1 DUF4349 domain-containing protein [Chryseobacterium sp. LJ668]